MDAFNIVTLIIAIIALIVAILSWRNSKQVFTYRLIEDIRKEYRSPEMFSAVQRLWQFYKEAGHDKEKLIENYKKDYNNKSEQDSLHYQRRVVSHFYQYVADLYDKRILSADIIFDTFSEKDLRIIPNILIPIETELPELIESPPVQSVEENKLSKYLMSLYRLYKDSIGFDC